MIASNGDWDRDLTTSDKAFEVTTASINDCCVSTFASEESTIQKTVAGRGTHKYKHRCTFMQQLSSPPPLAFRQQHGVILQENW
ncbi:hypothetical protein Plhal304r1_c008g0033911 [Plasmopara halstedii]